MPGSAKRSDIVRNMSYQTRPWRMPRLKQSRSKLTRHKIKLGLSAKSKRSSMASILLAIVKTAACYTKSLVPSSTLLMHSTRNLLTMTLRFSKSTTEAAVIVVIMTLAKDLKIYRF